MNEFEKLYEGLEIVNETEKAICVEVCVGFYGRNDEAKMWKKWLPKSVSQIVENKLVAIKGWFIDKECLEYHELISEEAQDRFLNGGGKVYSVCKNGVVMI